MTDQTDAAIDELLDVFATNVEVSRYAVENKERSIGQHVSALERYTTEAKAAIKRLVLESRLDEVESLIRIYEGQVKASVMLDLHERIAALQKEIESCM